jgi:hypothetical protein
VGVHSNNTGVVQSQDHGVDTAHMGRGVTHLVETTSSICEQTIAAVRLGSVARRNRILRRIGYKAFASHLFSFPLWPSSEIIS